LLYLNPQPEFEELKRHYPAEDYYAYKSGSEPTNIVNNEKLTFWRAIRNGILNPWSKILPFLQNEIERELAYLGPVHEGMRVLDIGCGVGDGLSIYRDRGASTYGVEIDSKACEEGRIKGHHIFCGQLFEAGFENEFFDIVRFHQSLEHMFSPRRILSEVYRILKREGRVWISLPNHDSIHSRLFGRWFYAIESPRHLFGFTPSTIAHLLAQTGFQIEHLHTYSLPGGICYSLEHWLNDHFRRKRPFFYGQVRVKWWYITSEPVLFFPRMIGDLFDKGEMLLICGRKHKTNTV
jgi:SAM-dependent methyltransferase